MMYNYIKDQGREIKTMTKFNSSTFDYKRHLTLEQAEAFKKNWDYTGEDEERTSTILFKKKTNDYTVRYGKRYNS